MNQLDDRMGHAGGWMHGWGYEGVWIWTGIGVLIIVLLLALFVQVGKKAKR